MLKFTQGDIDFTTNYRFYGTLVNNVRNNFYCNIEFDTDN